MVRPRSSSARAFRVGFVVIELAMMLIMVAVLKRAGRSAWWAALYAWHPLPISELAGSGHQEVIGVACLVGSLAIFTTVPAKTWRWTVSLALSALGKPITPAGRRDHAARATAARLARQRCHRRGRDRRLHRAAVADLGRSRPGVSQLARHRRSTRPGDSTHFGGVYEAGAGRRASGDAC